MVGLEDGYPMGIGLDFLWDVSPLIHLERLVTHVVLERMDKVHLIGVSLCLDDKLAFRKRRACAWVSCILYTLFSA